MIAKPTPRDWEEFRRLLTTFREAAPLSQEDLAKELGRPQSYVSRHETKLKMSVWEWLKWCDACKIDTGRFLKKLGIIRRRRPRRPKKT
jgi:hypothetical protein